ncbi:DUF4864 domain-containing protein [Flagellatimonas centrodinii]|uniref:DUF4864 domain-containing protein n=1 Tax=Flagellatimonas centrodinii TaxID=2806210 RepID=UPI001FEDE83C|nr:DUF4864 domain-containing protein [Flagellatimonas centrodinii]ULQ48135.1 DUF4864 domain-containing protein [Flagellatimonas centrodinii]
MRTLPLILGILALGLIMSLSPLGNAQAQYRLPQPSLSPEDVVRTQLAALKTGEDIDLKLVYAFASPRNREATGPAPRFIAMIREQYPELIGHRDATLAPTYQAGDEALLPVSLTDRDGKAFRYVFLLSRQTLPGCRRCWMTDGVVPPEALIAPEEAPPQQAL